MICFAAYLLEAAQSVDVSLALAVGVGPGTAVTLSHLNDELERSRPTLLLIGGDKCS